MKTFKEILKYIRSLITKKVIMVSIIILTGLTFLLALISTLIVTFGYPEVEKLKSYTTHQTSILLDDKNQVIVKLNDNQRRLVIPFEQIPKSVKNAVISMEDKRFYSHHGIDFWSTFRAVISLLDPTGKLVKSGGSTITQQLARSIFLTKERKITRKVSEWLLAIKIEQFLTKDEILGLYLNEVYWGHNISGIESASKLYFNKSSKDLTLGEITLIAGILGAPEAYSPHRNMKLAKWRQSLTLKNMLDFGYITKEEYENAKKEKVKIANSAFINKKLPYPYFTTYVLSLLENKYDKWLLTKGGLKIYTTLDSYAQNIGEKVIKYNISKLRKNVSQGALVSIDPNTGYIKSLVGGVDYTKSQFNRITQARRQPGSSFKPFVYVTAFNHGVTYPDDIVTDEKLNFPEHPNWTPTNYDNKYRGELTVQEAIENSVNTVAVKALDAVGTDKVIKTAKEFGIKSKLQNNYSLALGTSEVNPLELAGAYTVFATGGKKPQKITPIIKIEDKNGNILLDNSTPELTQIYSSRAVRMMNDSLVSAVRKGTGGGAFIPGIAVAGKTGTTSDYRDAWFVGYTPDLVTLIWIGNDNNSKMVHATGGSVCAPIWKNYMLYMVRNKQYKDFPKADGWFKDLGFKLKKQFKELIPFEGIFKRRLI